MNTIRDSAGASEQRHIQPVQTPPVEVQPVAVNDVHARLAEAEETLRAIRNGEVDALVVSPKGVFLIEIKSWPGELRGGCRPRSVADGPEAPAAFVDDPVPAIRRPRIDADDLHGERLGV